MDNVLLPENELVKQDDSCCLKKQFFPEKTAKTVAPGMSNLAVKVV
jgi:hypothetical protein